MENNMTEKYRAKRKEDGEWVYGYYVDYYRGSMIMSPLVIGEGINTVVETPVDPDTLSRCSGLTACGQEVYEGDVVRFHIDHTTEFWTAVVRFGWHDTYEYGWYLEPRCSRSRSGHGLGKIRRLGARRL